MSSKLYDLRLVFFTIALISLSLSLSILVLTSTLQLKDHPSFTRSIQNASPVGKSNWVIKIPVERRKKRHSTPVEFLAKEFKGRIETKIGLVNTDEGEEWEALGETSLVYFDRVPEQRRWEEFFPEWIDEKEKWGSPTCPEIPMPVFGVYDDQFDIVVSSVPCGNGMGREGARDVFRLQVNLVVANLVVRSGLKNNDDGGGDRAVFAVFIGSCEPMLEIFRCDDLVMQGDNFWIYKPDLRRLKQNVLMPVGSCQLAPPLVNQGEEKIKSRQAYVTVLHSSEAYVCGAIILAQSIIQSNSTKDLVLLADETITKTSRRALTTAGWKIKQIKRIRSPNARRNAYNEWNYSKLRIWQLTEYDKIIFIDSDLVALRNIDEFFRYPQLSAVGNDQVLFNSGIMLIEPSECTFRKLMERKQNVVSYNGGDQGFLNEVFTWWHRWPSTLNYLKVFEETKSSEREKLPESLYAIHYLGLKPWMCYRDYDCNWDMGKRRIFASDSAHRKWWQVFDAMPKRLRPYCSLTKKMDARINRWRERAKNASFPDGHWKIKVKDPRQHH